jgi:hypothetical protein
MLGDLGVEEPFANLAQPGMGAGFVALHETRIAGDVREDDRGKLAADHDSLSLTESATAHAGGCVPCVVG